MESMQAVQVFRTAFLTVPGRLTFAAAGALAAAIVAQQAGGLEPCSLCLLQREPYG